MEKILFAADELTGLIGAAAKMRPSKSCTDMELSDDQRVLEVEGFVVICLKCLQRLLAGQSGFHSFSFFHEITDEIDDSGNTAQMR